MCLLLPPLEFHCLFLLVACDLCSYSVDVFICLVCFRERRMPGFLSILVYVCTHVQICYPHTQGNSASYLDTQQQSPA